MGTVNPNDEPETQRAALLASNGDRPDGEGPEAETELEALEGAQDGPGAEEPAGTPDDAGDAGAAQGEPQGAPGAELNGGDGLPAEPPSDGAEPQGGDA